MTRIKAAVCTEHRSRLTIEELDLRAPLAGEVEVTLEAVAICHSDVTFADGGWGGDLPAVYGHEAAGRVTALGDGVQSVEIGARVVVTLIRACGSCVNCASGKPTICDTPNAAPPVLTRPDGTPVIAAMNCGAFAERVVVDQSQIVTLPEDMPAEAVALLACGVITGVGAVVNAAGLRAGQDVVVIGAGGVGLNAIQGARIAGARRIVAVDMSEEKLAIAREFGATDGVLATAPKPWQIATQLLGRGADAVIVTVGAIPAYDSAPRYLGWGGKVVMVGMPHSGAMSSYEPVVLAYMSQGMVGSKMGDVVIRRDIPWMADLYRQGRLKLDELVSGRWRLDQINEAIADTRSGGAKRNVILF
ncbi:zinc-binding dehydrogenase [Puniceibacterium sp. IMCC21224]|uniref:alcohol dehydrogenase catalytic domain-containing protein n=1 Tax=Puniceibacterium sp. IMCC21224 TaxID=1618204 RepID=UPI00064D72B3|nr:zinc-binding dehydrogenase [Puniceibacterium sp. IMCC21224]KMK68118.1 Zn-dependent alcohol dehydrogenase, class III [Puniceibacterium sp. IMCC21224]